MNILKDGKELLFTKKNPSIIKIVKMNCNIGVENGIGKQRDLINLCFNFFISVPENTGAKVMA